MSDKIRRAAALLLGLAVSAIADHGGSPGVVVLRGTPGGGDFQFVADQTDLDRAAFGGISGADLMARFGDVLTRQAGIYADAQAAAGAPSDRIRPLYVLLDPNEDWAYARPWGQFSYTARDGTTEVTVDQPLLHLGEKMALGGSHPFDPEAAAVSNQALIVEARRWYQESYGHGAGFDALILRGYRRPHPTFFDPERSVEEVARSANPGDFLSFLEGALREDTAVRRLPDPDSVWKDFRSRPGAAKLADRAVRATNEADLAATLVHETGHLIQFATRGLYGFRGSEIGAHMDGLSHSLDTLSTETAAFTEGFAEAHTMFLLGYPEEPTPGHANRIDYSSTLAFVSRRLEASEGQGGRPDPARSRLERIHAYLTSLQERRGSKRERYDFLRSEYAVAATLTSVRAELGPVARRLLIETMSRHDSSTLAALIEAYAHDHPGWAPRLYAALASATEGILVTQEQAMLVASRAAAGERLEIDIDRDGRVPGTDAVSIAPEFFPREPAPYPGDPDPLGQEDAPDGAWLLPREAGTHLATLPDLFPDLERGLARSGD